jgi:CSLREA domain-containing protein
MYPSHPESHPRACVGKRQRSRITLLFAVALALHGLATSTRADAAVVIVNTDDDLRTDRCDARHCTLREAIQAANLLPRGAEIRFKLPVSPYRIDLQRPLPALRGGVTLDGGSQPGAACPRPVVHINGATISSQTPVNGLELRGNRNRVRGVIVSGFSGNGILVDGNENVLQCLYVGVDSTGREARSNEGHGIAIAGGHSNRVGGPTAADGNLLSANGGQGLYIEDALNTYANYNSVGVDRLASPTLPNRNAELTLNPPPEPPNVTNPRAVAVLTRAAEQRIAAITREHSTALEDAGLYEKYLRLSEPGRGDATPPPADLFELVGALAEQPALYAAFTSEAAAILAGVRAEIASELERLRRVVRVALPAFGSTRPHPTQGQFDVLNHSLSVYAAGDYVTSGPPSEIVAVDTSVDQPTANPLSWHSLMTYGPTQFNDSDYFSWLSNPYPDTSAPFPGSSFLHYTCVNAANLPTLPACSWPLMYDLLPFSMQLVWQSTIWSAQEIEDIVQGNDYVVELRVNGQLLEVGPAPALTPSGALNVQQVPAGQGYYMASMPGGLSPKICPPNRNCLATNVLAQNVLAAIPQPWTFEIKVKERDELAVPIIVGVDELGNTIVATHGLDLLAHVSRTVHPNPSTGGQKWFTAALLETFKHPRCTDCHGFGTFENLAAHHGYTKVENFVEHTGLHLEPSLYVPGKHVMDCANCHEPIAFFDPSGKHFLENEWRAPFHDLDVNWALKNTAQICSRVKANLPSWGLRLQHFSGDARLFWAITDAQVMSTFLEKAPPVNDWDEFQRRVNLWNNFGAPCP